MKTASSLHSTQAADPRYLLKLTWPIFIELALQMLVGNVDQFMVSHYSQSGVAAIGNANQILNLLILTFSVISVAAVILIAQYLGANNHKRVSEIYTLSLFVNIVLGLLVAAVLVFGNGFIYHWMQLPDHILPEAQSYIQIIGSFMGVQAVFLTFTAIFRANALMKESMVISIIINAINIIGNFLLIGGAGPIPALGVAGAALSSNISRLIGVILIIILFIRRIDGQISLKYLRPFPLRQLKKLLSIGLPSGGESLSYNATQLVIQRFVNTFGNAAITTRVYACMFAMVTYLYSSAISQSSQIVVGYLIGARDLENADQRVKLTLKISVGVSFTVALIIFIFSEAIFGFFTTDPEVIALGKTIMLIDIFLEIGRAVNMVMVRTLQAAGDIRFPITLGILSAWTIAVGGGFVLGHMLGLHLVGIWIAMACDEITRACLFLMRWKSGKWKSKSLLA